MLNSLPFIILHAWGLWPEFAAEYDHISAGSSDGGGRDREFERVRRPDIAVSRPNETQRWQGPSAM